MATTESLKLPSIPAGWSGENNFRPLGKLSPATQRNIEPVGAHFLAEARRKRHKRTFSEDERIQAQESVKKVEDEDDNEISEDEDPVMLQRDAKDWKNQDHYAVLGLSRYRYKATDDQIKRAHRKKVLRHHPDKRAAKGSTEDDSFFKCIQRATEILTDPIKRRQYDSVDEAADVEPPSKKESKDNFYKAWNRVFVSEARFSNIKPVPKIGDDKSGKEDVERFYNFWYAFDSWRSFEYLNEDVPDDNEHRDQKRQMEKKNANARRKKKTEDTARLRSLVDEALSFDTRIKRFRQQEQEQKHKKRNEREAEAKKAAEEAKAKAEREQQEKVEKEAAEKAEKAEGKKAKEAAKNAVKKNKRVVRTAVKDANYFNAAGAEASPAQIDRVLNDVDLLLAKVDPDELAALTAKLSLAKGSSEIQGAFGDEVTRLVGAGKLKDGEAKSLTA